MEIKKYYAEEHRSEMLQLSDNHIDWDFGHAVYPYKECDIDKLQARYYMAQRLYKFEFECHYHVTIFCCGRSGRHVCVKDNAENRRRYNLMTDAVAVMQKLIVCAAVGRVYGGKLPRWLVKPSREIQAEIDVEYPLCVKQS